MAQNSRLFSDRFIGTSRTIFTKIHLTELQTTNFRTATNINSPKFCAINSIFFSVFLSTIQLSSESMIATSGINNNYGDFLKNGISSGEPTHIDVLKRTCSNGSEKKSTMRTAWTFSCKNLKKPIYHKRKRVSDA